MSTLYTILTIVYILFCLFFVSTILLQKQRSSGIGNLGGGGMSGNGNTMGRTTDDSLTNLTKYLGAIFFVLTILMSFVK